MKNTTEYIDPAKLKRGHTYVTHRADVVTVRNIDRDRKIVQWFNHTDQSNELVFFRNAFVVEEKETRDPGRARVLSMKAKFAW